MNIAQSYYYFHIKIWDNMNGKKVKEVQDFKYGECPRNAEYEMLI